MRGGHLSTILPLISVSIYLVYVITKFLHKLVWQPLRIQNLLNSQGFNGPPYRFFFGNAREIIQLRKESLAKPMPLLSHDLVPRVLPHLHFWMKKYGRSLMFWIGPEAHLVLTEPEMIKQALFNKDGNFPKAELNSDYLYMILGHGLVISEGEKWSKMRKLANFAFHGDQLKIMVPEMIVSAEMMLERWKGREGKEMDLFEEFRVFTGEVISRTAFGSSFQEGGRIFEMLNKLTILVEKNAFMLRLPIISKIFKSEDDREAKRLEQGIRDSILGIMTRREEKWKKNGEVDDGYGNDFMGLLLQAYHHDEDEPNKKISMEELIDECKTLYVAGQETTNVLLSWIALLLATHQDWQEQARNEVISIFGHHKIPDEHGITKLKIMSMIMNETLRLYTPVTGTFVRKVEEDVRLGHLTLPTGVRLLIPSIFLHHDPELWGEDVHDFKPQRFHEGIANATNNNPAAFFPFGMGPRICVGYNFAFNEVKIVLSMILQRYCLTLSPGYVHAPYPFLTIRPKNGMQVILNTL